MTRQLPITAARRLVLDGLSLSPRHVYYPVRRPLELAAVAAARISVQPRISWAVLQLKAMAHVCAMFPEFRRSYHRWPWPRMVEHDEIVGMLVVNRQVGDEERICWARFTAPHERSLRDLQTELDAYLHDPPERAFRKQFAFTRFPWPVRRLLWWWQLNFSGAKRPRRLGTFTQSSLATFGAENEFHQTLLSSSLSCGPVDAAGNGSAVIIADHRVLDGAVVARALAAFEAQLRGPLYDELRALSG